MYIGQIPPGNQKVHLQKW